LQSSDLTEADALSILPVLAKAKNRALTVKLLEGLRAKGLAGFHSLQPLGLVYKEAGRLDLARSTLEKTAQLQPNSVPVLISLAQVAYQQHDYTGALGYLAHARDLDPQNGGIHFFWGVICVEQNLTLEAYQALKKAVSLEPDNAYFNYAFGAVAMQRDNASESIPYLKKYCELRPHDPRGRLALGVAYFSSRDDEKAQQVMSTLVQYPETAATAHYYLGRIANQKGDFATAVRELRSALQASPNYADASAELGLLHMKQKEYPQAEEAFQRALKLNPDSYTANLNLMMLYQRTKDPRAEAQAKRFDKIKEEHVRRTDESLWTIEVQPITPSTK
jgi:tetratricopeptide (TPR) repeat protein